MISDLQSRLEKILSEPVKLSTTVFGSCLPDSQKLEMNSLKLVFSQTDTASKIRDV